MIDVPFEDPEKTALRGKCEQAVDAAGYRLVLPPEKIALPSDSRIQGHLIGDVQGFASDGVRNIHYLRTDYERALPDWLAKLASAALKLEDIQLYVVVEEVSPIMERSCRTAGAGLLRIVEGPGFERILAPSGEELARRHQKLLTEIEILRRKLDEQIRLHEESITQRYALAHIQTTGMPPQQRSVYFAFADAAEEKRVAWASDISRRLDTARDSGDIDSLVPIRAAIKRGIPD